MATLLEVSTVSKIVAIAFSFNLIQFSSSQVEMKIERLTSGRSNTHEETEDALRLVIIVSIVKSKNHKQIKQNP